MQIDIVNIEGKKVGQADLADAVFGAKVKEYLLWEVVKAQRAAKRGRHARDQDARRGSRRRQEAVQAEGDRQRAPGFDPRRPSSSAAARCSGPQPRDYAYTVPKKVKRAALASALSLRAQGEEAGDRRRVRVRRAQDQALAGILKTLGADSALVVDGKANVNLAKSAPQPAEVEGASRPRASTSTTSSTTRAW